MYPNIRVIRLYQAYKRARRGVLIRFSGVYKALPFSIPTLAPRNQGGFTLYKLNIFSPSINKLPSF